MNRNIQEIGGEILLVSQFTLYGDCLKGRRPSFTRSAPAHLAQPLYLDMVKRLKGKYPKVKTGVFQAFMQVELTNDGPITLIIDK
jgi:D-aminoacyl-tRNA deacylase